MTKIPLFVFVASFVHDLLGNWLEKHNPASPFAILDVGGTLLDATAKQFPLLECAAPLALETVLQGMKFTKDWIYAANRVGPSTPKLVVQRSSANARGDARVRDCFQGRRRFGR